MRDRRGDGSESRFGAYVEGLVSVIGHGDPAQPLRDYCMGLMMACERKSVEPMAAVKAPGRVAAQYQSLLHFVGEGRWSDEKVLTKVRALLLPPRKRETDSEAQTSVPEFGEKGIGVATFLVTA
jgi:SRSO17 transposase